MMRHDQLFFSIPVRGVLVVFGIFAWERKRYKIWNKRHILLKEKLHEFQIFLFLTSKDSLSNTDKI